MIQNIRRKEPHGGFTLKTSPVSRPKPHGAAGLKVKAKQPTSVTHTWERLQQRWDEFSKQCFISIPLTEKTP